jgi:hypothetical protein
MLVAPLFQKEVFLEKLKRQGREVERQFTLLCDFFTPRTVFMHIGAADCLLAVQAASYVERVYAIGAAEGITRGVRLPCNLRFTSPADGEVDVAFSARVAAGRLQDIHRSLAPKGMYLFQASGDSADARYRLRAAGFSAVRVPYLLHHLSRTKLLAAIK